MIKVVRFIQREDNNPGGRIKHQMIEADAPNRIPGCKGHINSLSLPAQRFDGIGTGGPIIIQDAKITLLSAGGFVEFWRGNHEDFTEVEVYISYERVVSKVEDMILLFSGLVSSVKRSGGTINILAKSFLKINRNKKYKKSWYGKPVNYLPIAMGNLCNVPMLEIRKSGNRRVYALGDPNFINGLVGLRNYLYPDGGLMVGLANKPRGQERFAKHSATVNLEGITITDTPPSDGGALIVEDFGDNKRENTDVPGKRHRPVRGVLEQIVNLLISVFNVPFSNIESREEKDFYAYPPIFGIYEKDTSPFEILQRLLNTCGAVLISVPGGKLKLKPLPVQEPVTVSGFSGLLYKSKGEILVNKIIDSGVKVDWPDASNDINYWSVECYLANRPNSIPSCLNASADKNPVEVTSITWNTEQGEVSTGIDEKENSEFGKTLKIQTANIVWEGSEGVYETWRVSPSVIERFKPMIENQNARPPTVEFSTVQELTEFELLDIVSFNPLINGEQLAPEGRYIITKIDYTQGKLALRWWGDKLEE